MPATPDIRTPVLIVGSGLAGLTTALMLAWRGVRPPGRSGTAVNLRARTQTRVRNDRFAADGELHRAHAPGS
jgi:thioredoxin reductase